MIEVISSWAKSLGVTIVLVSILEMILPNNKTKKYIRMVLGIFVIFNVISPFINNKDKLSLASINVEDYYQEGISNSNTTESINSNNEALNQTSMDVRIKQLYEDELEKDIIKKIEELGYEVDSCKVEADVPTNESTGANNEDNETGITKIQLKIKGKQENQESTNVEGQEETIENKLVTGVQRVKGVDIDVNQKNNENQSNSNIEDKASNTVTRSDIQNIKKFLIEEYGVSEKCLEIN